MKWFASSKISCVLLVFVAILPVAAVLGQSAITSDTEVVMAIAGQEHRYQPRPELGYVVKSQDYDQAIASTYGDISLLAEMQIRPIGGREREGLWVVERQRRTQASYSLANSSTFSGIVPDRSLSSVRSVSIL